MCQATFTLSYAKVWITPEGCWRAVLYGAGAYVCAFVSIQSNYQEITVAKIHTIRMLNGTWAKVRLHGAIQHIYSSSTIYANPYCVPASLRVVVFELRQVIKHEANMETRLQNRRRTLRWRWICATVGQQCIYMLMTVFSIVWYTCGICITYFKHNWRRLDSTLLTSIVVILPFSLALSKFAVITKWVKRSAHGLNKR